MISNTCITGHFFTIEHLPSHGFLSVCRNCSLLVRLTKEQEKRLSALRDFAWDKLKSTTPEPLPETEVLLSQHQMDALLHTKEHFQTTGYKSMELVLVIALVFIVILLCGG